MQPLRLGLALFGLTLAAGCIRDTRPTRERGTGNLFDSAPEIAAPKTDRCSNYGKSALKAQCDEAKYLAHNYIRQLSPGDSVCLEGGFGEEVGAACEARATVADAELSRVLIEIREAQPQSRWYKHVQHQIWFAEGALIDLYLAERGY